MKQILFLITMIMTTLSITAQEKKDLEETKGQLDFFQKEVGIPSNYHFKEVYQVPVDNLQAYWYRYQKADNQGLLHEHFSFIVTKDTPYRVLGFTYMDSKYVGKAMVPKENAGKIARDFLIKLDAKFEKELTNQWIDRHDEEIIVDNKKQTIGGMKYKCYRESKKDYAWVIVGHDGTIITFERDILWSNGMQKRLTNKWLHDNWLLSETNIK